MIAEDLEECVCGYPPRPDLGGNCPSCGRRYPDRRFVPIREPEHCPVCGGTGEQEVSADYSRECPRCHGRVEGGHTWVTCLWCDGYGFPQPDPFEDGVCEHCHGCGLVWREYAEAERPRERTALRERMRWSLPPRRDIPF